MSHFTIIGAGQSGLQLAIGLLGDGHDVTVVSNRSGEQIREGKVMSSQCMFDTSRSYERDLGIGFWEESTPDVEGIGLTVPSAEGNGTKDIDWRHRLDKPAKATDQRIKMPRWIGEFVARGGEFILQDVGIDELETYAASSDLTIVASGKGEIASLFERDAAKSPYSTPQRALALTYVTGLEPVPEYSTVTFNLLPGIGEYFVYPAETVTGPCNIMIFEAIPGGPADRFHAGLTPEEHLATSLGLLNDFLPWEAARATDIALTDPNGTLSGRFAPTVRKPIATLPSGRTVLGLADVVVLNDPLTGQGSNNASKCAHSYLQAIRAHDGAYDDAFKQKAFDEYWADAQHVTNWTNALLAPPPEFALSLLGAAGHFPAIAKRFVNGFDDPTDYATWFLDPDGAAAYLAEFTAPVA